MNRKHIIRNLRQRGIAFDHNLGTQELQGLLDAAPAQNRIAKTFNYAQGGGKISLTFNAAKEDEPAQIMMCDDIGKDPWSGEGISVKDIQEALNAITPKNRQLDFMTNSPGGSVSEGCAIRNLLQQWPGRITNTIIGIAASTASWCVPADETKAYKSSQMFLHRSWGMVVGNADDMRSGIQFLETTDGQISEMYADAADGDAEDFMGLMKSETLLTGQQACDLGLVDTIIDGEAKNQFTTEMLNAMKQKLAALNSTRISTPTQGVAKNQPENTIMNKTEMLALLNKWGVTVPENATDEQLKKLVEAGKPAVAAAPAAPAAANTGDAKIAELEGKIARLTEADNAAKNLRITNRVEQLVKDDKIPANLKDKIVLRAQKDETVLDEYEAMPSKPPGAEPVGALLNQNENFGNESAVADIQKFVVENGPKFRGQFIGAANAGKLASYNDDQKKKIMQEMGNRARAVARVLADPKNKAKILAAWNTNTIDPGLQRQVILQEYVEEYEIQLLPLRNFSVLFSDLVLEGTDELDLPFYNLQTTASNSWSAASGYNTATNNTVNTRKIFIGGSGVTSGANAAAGYCKDRLWQMLTYSSYEQTRQPYINWQKLTQQNARKLGVDVFQQFISRVITAANFGAAAKILPAAQFTADDVADLAEQATGLNWPVADRSLTLNHTYRTPLLKDTTFKQYLSYGSTDPIRKAVIQEAYGFSDINIVPNLLNYSPAGENLIGWINHLSAALFGTAPIMPTEEVRALMTRFDIAISPQLGANICYRRFGNTTLDQTNEVVECSFGGGLGVASALKRFTSQ